MSILIRGMEMPKDAREAIIINYNGKASRIRGGRIILEGSVEESNLAYELPPHGRLINADALVIPKTHVDMFENCRNCMLLDEEQVREIIANAPTIIEAEGTE